MSEKRTAGNAAAKKQSHDPTESLRAHLLELLGKGNAHADYASAVANLPEAKRGEKLAGVPHTAWRPVEHMRITQLDILEFTRDAQHKSPNWPDDYWPPDDAPPNAKAWTASIASFKKDRAAMIAIVEDKKNDLFAPLPHGQGQTIAREAMLPGGSHGVSHRPVNSASASAGRVERLSGRRGMITAMFPLAQRIYGASKRQARSSRMAPTRSGHWKCSLSQIARAGGREWLR